MHYRKRGSMSPHASKKRLSAVRLSAVFFAGAFLFSGILCSCIKRDPADTSPAVPEITAAERESTPPETADTSGSGSTQAPFTNPGTTGAETVVSSGKVNITDAGVSTTGTTAPETIIKPETTQPAGTTAASTLPETTITKPETTSPPPATTSGGSGDGDIKNKMIDFSWASDGKVINITSGTCRGPRVIKLSDASMLCAYNGATIARSTDDGLTWKVIATAAKYPGLTLANPNLYEDTNGDVYLCFRANAQMTDYYYASLHCCVSRDRGYTWEELPLICEYKERGVWEPHLGRLNGVLTVFYANDCISAVKEPYQNIEYLQFNGEKWTNRTVVLDGAALKSRPGMPVWRQLSDGTYFCVIEGWIPGTSTLHLQYTYSEDGVKWSNPVSVYKAKTGFLAGNPTFYELPTGQIIISYQTNENAAEKGSEDRTTKTIISNGTDPKKLTAADFGTPQEVYATKAGYQTLWGSVYYSGKYLYVSVQTNYPTSHGVLVRYEIP